MERINKPGIGQDYKALLEAVNKLDKALPKKFPSPPIIDDHAPINAGINWLTAVTTAPNISPDNNLPITVIHACITGIIIGISAATACASIELLAPIFLITIACKYGYCVSRLDMVKKKEDVNFTDFGDVKQEFMMQVVNAQRAQINGKWT